MQKTKKKAIYQAYKEYVLANNKLPKNLKKVAKKGKLDLSAVLHHFRNLQELEIKLIERYFKKAKKVMLGDENMPLLTDQEKHLSFLFCSAQAFKKDTLFLEVFIREKTGNVIFWTRVNKKLFTLDLGWHVNIPLPLPQLQKLGGKGYKSLLINQALSTLLFWSKDRSNNKVDTDAFIEKSSHLLFQLADFSTMEALFGFGKFMYSRKNWFHFTPLS